MKESRLVSLRSIVSARVRNDSRKSRWRCRKATWVVSRLYFETSRRIGFDGGLVSSPTSSSVLLRSQDGEPGSLAGQNLIPPKVLSRHLFGFATG